MSIGYSACHWCHVMEHETFEDSAAAAFMNEHFINIKVDREERPDVDGVYMTAVQLMTQRGGWPLNAVCMPDGRPVYGGTYFPRERWLQALQSVLDTRDTRSGTRRGLCHPTYRWRATSRVGQRAAPRRLQSVGNI